MEVDTAMTVVPPPPPPLPPAVPASKRDDGFSRTVSCMNDDPSTAAVKVLRRQMDRICKGDETVAVVSKLCPIEPVLQRGPQCGLVALVMASQLLQPSSPVCVTRAFETAKALGFTSKGEMFSVENMRLLSEHFLDCQSEVLHCPIDHRRLLIEHLLRGKPILVPYDSDGNFEPCLKGGHTAHWAVIHGFCLVLPAEVVNNAADCSHWENDFELGKRLRHIAAGSTAQTVTTLVECSNSIFVYASQGKSRQVGLWDLECLLRSNANLAEATRKHDDVSEFVLPSGGLMEGLAGKLLLLR
ncbi:unnamed protein product [Ixodes hexagonus]